METKSEITYPTVFDGGALRFPAIDVVQGALQDGWERGIAGIQRRVQEFQLPETKKHTGLEKLSHEQFMAESESRKIFGSARTNPIFLESSWDLLLKALYAGHTGQVREWRPLALKVWEVIRKKNLIELGVGDTFARHKQVFKKTFGVASFRAMDRQPKAKTGAEEGDALDFLTKLPDNSANITAYGLFNEPLSIQLGEERGEHSPLDFLWPARNLSVATNRQFEHEYLRRLARELYRVVPPNGILFGAGLHPVGIFTEFNDYLLAAGFYPDKECQEFIRQRALEHGGSRREQRSQPHYDAFFFRK